jgi:hypothetical protein
MFPLANAYATASGPKNSPGWLPLDEKTFRRIYLEDVEVDGRIIQNVSPITKNH